MLDWNHLASWLRTRWSSSPRGTRAARLLARRRRSRKLELELLEDRTLPSVSFAPAVPYSAGSAPNGVVSGDFNGDAKLDLAVANTNGNTVSVLLGNGDGTFQSQHTYATGSFPVNVTVADVNGDGKLDLVVANAGSANVGVLLGNGDGTFQSQQIFATGSSPNSVVVGDFNGDGKLDLAVANDGSANVSVLLGNGDGTFQTQQTLAAGSGSASVVEGDFNGDGKLDLAVGNYNSHTVSVLLGNGDGTFQSQQTFATSSGPYLAVGDFNGDGKLDLAVDNFDSANVGVLLGNGDGTFQSQQTFATGTGPLLLTVGDFNSDGKLDLAVANIHSNTVSVLVSNGDGTFQSQRTFATGLFPDSVAVGDFNGDGKLDLATADEGSHEVSALLNRAPTVTAVDAGGTYNGSPFPAIGSNVGVDGTTAVSGSYTFIYTNAADGSTSSSAPVNAGSYTVVAHFTSSDLTYSDANSGPTSFTIAQAPLIGSITAANKVDDGTTAATITSRTLTGVLPADLSNVSYVGGTATFADPFVGTGKTVTATGLSLSGSAASNYSVNTTATTTADITPLGITPASLSGTVFEDFNNDGQVDFGEEGISGVSITLTGTDDLGHAVNLSQTTDGDGAYIFQNLRPGSYTLTETQPAGFTQGINSIGSAGGTQALDQFFVQLAQGVDGLNYNFGERPVATGTVQQGQTAGIGFWNNKNGQALILALNGGTGHQLGDWLAATLVNLYGANSANDLAGTSNAYVAALFQKDFVKKGQKLDAQVLATALSVYATNATLDDTQVAAAYGFAVRGDGLGTATVNVGSSGGAFGVANNTTMTVLDLLLAADAQAVNGLLYNGIVTLRNEANNVFSALNQAGAIG